MKRLPLGLLTVFLLSGCAPILSQGAADPSPAVLTLAPVAGQSYKAVSFAAGPQATTATTLTLSGVNLSVNDTRCAPVKQQLVCDLGPRAANTTVTIFGKGVIVAEADYTRPDGKNYHLSAD